MKADPDAQRRLLELQAVDTALAQIAHKERNLPELAQLEQATRKIVQLEDERARVQAAIDDLDRDIARLERDTEQVRARADRDKARLDAGLGPPRELEALQHELATLSRRQNELEDAELAIMEQREARASELAEVDKRLEDARAEQAGVAARRDEALAELDRERRRRQDARGPLAASIPADLLDLYESLRQATGIGAALLRAGQCGGCRLELAGSELSRVRSASPDEVVRCEECRRILVRTEESGL